jgi:hypothetical protein
VKIIGYVILDKDFRRHRIHGRVYASYDRAASIVSGNALAYKNYPESRNGYKVYPAHVNEEA